MNNDSVWTIIKKNDPAFQLTLLETTRNSPYNYTFSFKIETDYKPFYIERDEFYDLLHNLVSQQLQIYKDNDIDTAPAPNLERTVGIRLSDTSGIIFV